MNKLFLVLVVLPNLFLVLSRELNRDSLGLLTELNLFVLLMLLALLRVVLGLNLLNLDDCVVVGCSVVVKRDDLKPRRVLDLDRVGGLVAASNLEAEREGVRLSSERSDEETCLRRVVWWRLETEEGED